jgi:hypothetical protein
MVPMVDPLTAIDEQPRRPWQFTLRGLFLLTFSVAIGLSFWKVAQDWFVAGLGTLACWIVFGLAAQVRDIWQTCRQPGRHRAVTSEERWGCRFEIAWRLSVCLLFAVSLVVWSFCRFPPLAIDADSLFSDFFDQDCLHVSPRGICEAVLLCSIMAAIIGSRGLAQPGMRRPWSWGVYVFRGFVAAFLFLTIMQGRLDIVCIIHIVVVGVLYALSCPCGHAPDVAMKMVEAASQPRVTVFYHIATAGAVLVLVNCILTWQFSARWRTAARPKICLGLLLAAGLAAMFLLTARIVVVEIPTMSPVMVAATPLPPPISSLGAVVLAAGLAAAVACRWSASPSHGAADARLAWRHDPSRYYHERLLVLLPLGGVALGRKRGHH